MKYIKIILQIAFIMLLCNGCKGKQGTGNEPKDSLSIENDSNVIRIATLSQSISYYEKEDEPTGYEYEAGCNFAESIGKKAKFIIAKTQDELIEMLDNDSCDLIAYPLAIRHERKEIVKYTNKTYITEQILVQRKPVERRRRHKRHHYKHKAATAINTPTVIKDITELLGKEVWVMKGSKYEERLKNINNELGGGIIVKTTADKDEEDLIDMVAKGNIQYTICDENVAMTNNTDYNNLDISLKVSFPQKAAWAVKDTTLLKEVNAWAADPKKAKEIAKIYSKYFTEKHYLNVPDKTIIARADRKGATRHKKIPNGLHEISMYDPYFRENAQIVGWDWRWIAAIAHQESKFNPNAISWGGARGLMQLMPATGARYGIKKAQLLDPEINVRTACKYLAKMEKSFSEVKNVDEKVKFTLASYNAGIGHVKDAQALAKKYGKDPNVWKDNVEPFLIEKSNPKYYNDPVCKHGYLHGNSVCRFVDIVTSNYERYKGISTP